MKKRLLLATAGLLFAHQMLAATLGMCRGEYAYCAASGAVPTGKTITVNGKVFKEGMAICPILKGDALADLSLMKGSCKAPPGKVWVLFTQMSQVPQAPTWSIAPAVTRSFILTSTPESEMSNMWSFLCDRQTATVNGVALASCYGPLNQSPWAGYHVVTGEKIVTQAPVGATYSVGYPVRS